ncbi:MAG TPA: glycine cleavage system protein GcvH, partial [Planctomycetaceae bacterium]|nr:glycine cleavage system protein GcvH [Planctomycetaceae bacterium]
TDFAVNALTDLVYIDLPEVGTQLEAGQTFGEVESVKAVSDLYAPVSGEVMEANTSLAEDLDALSQDPFGRGWLIRLKITDPSGLDALMDRKAYEAHCETEEF